MHAKAAPATAPRLSGTLAPHPAPALPREEGEHLLGKLASHLHACLNPSSLQHTEVS